MKWRRSKPEEKSQGREPFRIPNVTYSMPDIRHDLWKCNRCGSPVYDGELELHASFHKTQDVLLEKLMLGLEKFEEKDEAP